MQIKNAELGKEYYLKATTSHINRDFDNAKVKFTKVTGATYSIDFWKTDGYSGNTSINADDLNWKLIPIVKDWDQ